MGISTALLGKFIDFDKSHACPDKFALALFNKRKLFLSPNHDASNIYRELNRMYNR